MRKAHQKLNLTLEEIEAMRLLRRDGQSVGAIARRFGLPLYTVTNALAAMNELETGRPPLTESELAEIRELRELGVSFGTIARNYGTSVYLIKKALGCGPRS